MNVTVKRTPQIGGFSEPERLIIFKQFYSLLRAITLAPNYLKLHDELDSFKSRVCFHNELHHFHWSITEEGFWVKQRGDSETLLFMEL